MSGEQGSCAIALLNDGVIKVDGGAMFGQVPKALWEATTPADRRNRVRLGLNCLLIRANGQNVLVDTGVGTKASAKMKDIYGLSTSKLSKELREHGLGAKDIHAVVLSHLHFDHAGGNTKLDRDGTPVPAFPKATYFIQRAEWEEASCPNERSHAAYQPDDFLPLKESDQLHLLDGDQEVAPGVWVAQVPGHTSGHQIVKVSYGGEKLVFLGDLVPTHHHLGLPYIAAYDRFPEEVLSCKRTLLDRAEREGWLLIFAHGLDQVAGYLETRSGKRTLRPVDLKAKMSGQIATKAKSSHKVDVKP